MIKVKEDLNMRKMTEHQIVAILKEAFAVDRVCGPTFSKW